MSNRLLGLELFHLRLPFRGSFTHAAAQRSATDTVVVAALLADGTIGFGEGLPREYVTGETIDSVLYNVNDTLASKLTDLEPKSFTELLERLDLLPFTNEQGNIINSARCCVELALLDAYGKYFGNDLSSLIGWLGDASFARPTGTRPLRVSGVLDGSDKSQLSKRLRMMRLYGLRDFKLKVGSEQDIENLEMITRRLGRGLSNGRFTLRVDANGAWDIDQAVSMSRQLLDFGVCCLEEPLASNDRSHWPMLANLAELPLMADESLVSLDDAHYLSENDIVDYFNIRISKNGGLLPALRLAALAAKRSKQFQLGAMVGETGILAAAGAKFLQLMPTTSFTEICYSTFLLQADIVRPSVRFGWAGRLPKLSDIGLGVHVRRERILQFLVGTPRKIDIP